MNTSKKVIATLVTTVIGLAGVSGVIAATQNESDRSEQGEQLEALKAKVDGPSKPLGIMRTASKPMKLKPSRQMDPRPK